jgi:hypothetical protein
MEIPRDPNPIDAARRRLADAARRTGAAGQPAVPPSVLGDAVTTAGSANVERYVAMLKAHSSDPAKLEALRRSLEDGSFSATPEELVDPLLGKLDESGG